MGTTIFKAPDASTAHPYALTNLATAGKAISDSLTGVGTIIQDAADKHDDAITQNVLNRLSKIQNPDDIKALQQSGELDVQMQNMYNIKNQANVRDAFQNRINNIQTNIGTAEAFTTARQDFKAKQAEYNNMSDIDKAKAFYSAGHINEANALAAKVSQKLEGVAPMYGKFATDEKNAHQYLAGLNKAAEDRSIAFNKAANEDRTGAVSQLNATVAAANTTKNSINDLNNRLIGGANGPKATMELIKSVVEPDMVDKVARFSAKALASNPLYSKLPIPVFESILMNFGPTVGHFWSMFNRGDDSDMRKLLDEAVVANQASMLEHQNNLDELNANALKQAQSIGTITTSLNKNYVDIVSKGTKERLERDRISR